VAVTHDPNEAEQLGERAIALHEGKIVAVGPTAEVLQHAGLAPTRTEWVSPGSGLGARR
jgi:ABC-type sulfate/molybdate transport systems ATPase subunit